MVMVVVAMMLICCTYRSVFQGLSESPKAGEPPPHVSPSCVIVVFAKMIAPASLSVATMLQSSLLPVEPGASAIRLTRVTPIVLEV